MIRSVRDLDIEGKKVFIRCDFNVPLDEFNNITDDRRVRSAVQTIRYCLDHNCAIILASHLGRPKGAVDEKYSLAPVQMRLKRLLDKEIILALDVVGKDAQEKAQNLQNGEILLAKWKISVNSEGTQSISKEVLAGPEKIAAYFNKE